jgi:prolyl-tRNA synthetase
MQFAHTTSWGVSTRLIGGLIMTHGDDDGLRTPPRIAPKQIVIVPMLRDKPEDADVLAYCEGLVKELNTQTVFGQPLRAHVDKTQARSADKRWDWVRRGAPLLLEIGPRDATNGQVSYLRRDLLRDGDKIKTNASSRADFVANAAKLLVDIQETLRSEAADRLKANIKRDVRTFAELAAYFGTDDEGGGFKGWVQAGWSKPSGAALDAIDEKLKTLKLTLRNAPLDQSGDLGTCLFTGEKAVEHIIISRAY